jgi:carboxymethylenebutenolidase
MNKRVRSVYTVLILLLALPAWAGDESVNIGAHKDMKATLVTPEGAGPFPGVLVLHTSGGLQNGDLKYAERLAQEGYVCLVPEFMAAYGITGKTRQLTFTKHAEAISSDLDDGLEYLKKLPNVNKAKLGAVGFSNGGYWALMLAAQGKVQVGVSNYGAVTGAGTDRDLKALDAAFSSKSSPVLILHGDSDSEVPVAAAKKLGSLLEAKRAPYEIKIYPHTDHRYDRSGKAEDAEAAADSWQRTLEAFAKYLKAQPQ